MDNFFDNTLPKIGYFALSCWVASWAVGIPLILIADLRPLWGNERLNGSILDLYLAGSIGVGLLFYIIHCNDIHRAKRWAEIKELRAENEALKQKLKNE